MASKPVNVAIIGSGPSGFYTAEALVKSGVDCRIDIIERLPAPHGLIRYGVAPDHQTTKNVSRAFDKTAGREQVQFYGNVEVGKDITIEELKSCYDAVVLAVGSPYDRKLNIPGEDKKGVYGSASFVGWYNGHPDFRELNPDLDTKNVCIIGNGNVAIDCARVLVKTREEMGVSDMPDYAVSAIEQSPITDVYMLGRRGPVEAKFTNVELREMGELQTCVPVIDGSILPDAVPEDVDMSDRDRRVRDRNLATLREFAERDPNELPKRVHFEFFAAPREILGDDRVEAMRFERTKVEDGRAVGTGEFFDIETRLVIAAIGYRGLPIPGLPFDDNEGVIPNHDGRVGEGVYVVGWIGRGPTGTIGTNRPDGQAAAKHIVEDCQASEKGGREAFEAVLESRGARRVDYQEWLKLDEYEKTNAPGEAPRRKLVTVSEMLEVLGS
jgi:ferredoxin--NADP+ reductase